MFNERNGQWKIGGGEGFVKATGRRGRIGQVAAGPTRVDADRQEAGSNQLSGMT